MPAKLDISTLSQISLEASIINFFIVMVLSFALQQCYIFFGRSMLNRKELGFIFPLLSMTTFLIILVVKSSLALSLGLVGALSIVRFRTAIKDPESLGYLFLSIAIGLGMGADRTLLTITISTLIMISYAIYGLISGKMDSRGHLFLNLMIPTVGNDDKTLPILNSILKNYAHNIHLKRMDIIDSTHQFTYLLDVKDQDRLDQLNKELIEKFPKIQISMVDQKSLMAG